jgi:membrane protein involved in colicin uptake
MGMWNSKRWKNLTNINTYTSFFTAPQKAYEEMKAARAKAEADAAAAKAEVEAKVTADAAAVDRRRQEKTKGGRNSTMLTAGMDEVAAPTGRTTLGGY